MEDSTDSLFPPAPLSSVSNRVYKRRWFMVAVLALLNISNAMMWISYSPILDDTAKYYNRGSMDINWLSLVYPVTAILLSFPVIWLNDAIGLRATLIASGWVNAIGGALRVLSSLTMVPSSYHYWLALAGQVVASLAQPVLLFTSTKLVAIWFPDNQRVIANSLASMSNPLGVLVGNAIAPLIAQSAADLPRLNWVYFGPAALGALLPTLGVWSSHPPSPPSETAAIEAETSPEQQRGHLGAQIKQALGNPCFWVLLLMFGYGMALFTTLGSMLEQIVCPAHYSDLFSGLATSLMMGVGLVSAAITGLIVDRTKRFVETVIVCFGLATVGAIAFSLLSTYSDLSPAVAVSLCWIGCFGFAAYPTALELGVECTYPIGETVSTGLMVTAGQVLSVVLIFAMQFAAQPLDGGDSRCKVHYTYATYGLAVLCVLVALVGTACLRTEYRRLRVEQHAREERLRVQVAADSTQLIVAGNPLIG